MKTITMITSALITLLVMSSCTHPEMNAQEDILSNIQATGDDSSVRIDNDRDDE
ncbi:hypothetical protein [Robertkochia solimangrovi]|uniref:hypothetical protein n=1 Tax=Robertkochia solimangrovi TaxID=2213046 RepID=UPI0013A5464D|nr:hypothetical protein [Robertkochia solimangrovi]